MKTKLLLFNSILFSCFLLSAQSYQLSVDNVEYVPLENSISLTNGQLWDDEEIMIPESFTYDLFGEPTTSNVLDPNGLLGDDGFYSYTSFSGILPFYADLIDLGFIDGQSRSDISYLIEGNNGERVLKIEWTNVGFFEDLYYNAGQSFVNFQLWIYENDGTIEIYYGDSDIKDENVFSYYGGGPLVGLFDTYSDNTYAADEFIVLVGDPANPSIQIWEGEFDFDYASLLELNPAAGTRYTFTPGLGVSADEIEAQSNRFTVYPNPVSTELNLKASKDSALIESVEIYNNDGRLIKTIFSDFSNIDVADLVNGVYHLNVLTEDGLAVKRFVKID